MMACFRSQEALAQPLFSIGWSDAATVMPQQRQYFFFGPGYLRVKKRTRAHTHTHTQNIEKRKKRKADKI